jgi:UDP-N-acetylmuramate--alanine ligase
VLSVPDKEDVPERLLQFTQPGDVVLTLGAGDIWRYGKAFLESLQEQDAPTNETQDVQT